MTSLVSEAEIALSDPARLARRLTEHLVEHEVEFETKDGRTVADLGRGRGVLSVAPASLTVRVEAEDAGDLEMLRAVFAEHISEFADEEIEIRWSGLPANPRFANFREVRLVSARDVTPRLRRLTFEGHDLARFASEAELHVRLYFPPEGVAPPQWPVAGADGRVVWPPEGLRPEPRYYTIRSINAARGTFEIDFVLHADGGPGASFAQRARPGDLLGMAGPLGRSIGAGSWHLLAGDETALPAIARILEGMSADARGVALIEVADRHEETALRAPAGMVVRWLHRDGVPAGSRAGIETAIRDVAIPDGETPFVWIGCEFALAKALRQHVKKERGLSRDRLLIVGYWSREDH